MASLWRPPMCYHWAGQTTYTGDYDESWTVSILPRVLMSERRFNPSTQSVLLYTYVHAHSLATGLILYFLSDNTSNDGEKSDITADWDANSIGSLWCHYWTYFCLMGLEMMRISSKRNRWRSWDWTPCTRTREQIEIPLNHYFYLYSINCWHGA